MCQFNFIVLEKNSNENKIREIANASNLNFNTISLKSSNPNLFFYLTSKKECNCGSIIGSEIWKVKNTFDLLKEQKKLEKKRFSKNRIELLLKQKQDEFNKENIEKEKKELNETQNWSDFINAMKSAKIVEKTAIMFHNFSSDFNTEILKLNEVELNEISKKSLMQIKEDEVNWFKLI